MGTDIVLWVEYKDETGKWKDVTDYDKIRCESCKGLGQIIELDKTMNNCTECDGKGHVNALRYSNRCYTIYNVLSGFRPEPGIIPISKKRGMPEDYKEHKEYEEYFSLVQFDLVPSSKYDATSYHTLKQLKDYDWDAVEKVYDRIKKDSFYNKLMPALQRASDKYGGDDNIRIVFYYW